MIELGEISNIIVWVEKITSDLMPLLLTLVGVFLGLWIAETVVNLSSKNKKSNVDDLDDEI